MAKRTSMAERAARRWRDWVVRASAHGLSTRIYLVALVVALIGPGLVFTSILLQRYGASERARFEQDAREVVQQVAGAVNRDIEGVIAALRSLAAATALRNGDMTAFEARMRALSARSGLELTLRHPDGRVVATTALAPGAPLPVSPQPYDEAVVRQRMPVVSGALPSLEPAQASRYAVALPVLTEGTVDYILSAQLPAERLLPVLLGEAPTGWTVRAIDQAGIVLAHSARQRETAGRPVVAALRAQLAHPGAVFDGKDGLRNPVLFATARVAASGWTIGASVSQAMVDARVTRWVWAFAGFGLLTLAISSLLAVRLWARVADPLRQLAKAGDGLSRGVPVPRVTTPVREIRQLGDVLAKASADLRSNMQARDHALHDQALGLAALRESEARFRHMADSAPALIWMTDETAAFTFVNLHFDHVFGRFEAQLAVDGWRRLVHPEDVEDFSARFLAAFAAREPFRAEVRVRDRDGRTRWLRCESVPRLDDAQRFLGYTGCGVDITDIKAAEEALRSGTGRLQLALEAGGLGIWELDLRTGERHLSTRSAAILDAEAEGMVAREHWRTLVHPDDQARIEAALQTLIAGEGTYDVEFRVTDRDDTVRWIGSQAILESAEGGVPRRIVGIHQDVTARKRAEEHQRLLIHELNHRVKNTLATVQSIAVQTLRPVRGPEADAARGALESRLVALARAHDVLTRERWESADLADVVAQATAPHEATGSAGRFVTTGPRLRLPPRIALSTAMALHELATNAVKYGALSRPEGRVAIDWSVTEGRRIHAPRPLRVRLPPDRAQPRARARRDGGAALRAGRCGLHHRCTVARRGGSRRASAGGRASPRPPRPPAPPASGPTPAPAIGGRADAARGLTFGGR